MSEVIKYQGNFLKVVEQEIENHIWEKVFLPSAVVIFPVNEKGEILLIEEYRPHELVTKRLKLVTGHIEKGEDILLCSNRELQEEVGFRANLLENFYTYHSSGTVNSELHFILARDLIPSKLPNPDGEHTIIGYKFYPLEDIPRMLKSGELGWGISSIGFFILLDKLTHKK